MFETLGDMAATAVGSLVEQFGGAGEKLAENAAKAAGGRLLDWFKGKLTDPADSGVLEKLEADPQSEGAQRMLEGALLARLEKDESLASEVTALLRELGAGDHSVNQTMSQKGDGNVGTQISGSGNQVNVTRRD